MSGFKKRTATNRPTIPGTVISPKSLQLLTSSGIKSLDNLINGGLPVGTLVLFEDYMADSHDNKEVSKTNYSKVLINHFMEEGVSCNHGLLVASCGEKFTLSPSNLSAKDEVGDQDKCETSSSDETLRIAWRYRNQMPSVNDTKENTLKIETNHATSSTEMARGLKEICVSTWDITDLGSSIFNDDIYSELFKTVYKTCSSPKYNLQTLTSNTSSAEPSLMRIAIIDIGGLTCSNQTMHGTKLLQFLYALKSLARNRLCVIALTQTTNMETALELPALQGRIRDMADFVFKTSPLKQETNLIETKQSKSHHGIFHIIKTPSLKSLKSPSLRNHGKYLFKSTRTKFILEKMHLPPELNYAADNPKQTIDF